MGGWGGGVLLGLQTVTQTNTVFLGVTWTSKVTETNTIWGGGGGGGGYWDFKQ